MTWTEQQKAVLRGSVPWWGGWLSAVLQDAHEWAEPITLEEANDMAARAIEDYLDHCDPSPAEQSAGRTGPGCHCGRLGTCPDCCCAGPSHTRDPLKRPCPLCQHVGFRECLVASCKEPAAIGFVHCRKHLR